MNRKDAETQRDPRTERVIGLAIEVHRQLGPGLLESAYEECLCYELREHAIEYARQVSLPIHYKSVRLQVGYRIDILVEAQLVIELKTVEQLLPIHNAQLLTYLRLAQLSTGLLLNFNAPVLKEGLRRLVLSQFEGNRYAVAPATGSST